MHILKGYFISTGRSYDFSIASEVALNIMGKIEYCLTKKYNNAQTLCIMQIWEVMYIDGLMQERRNSSVLAMDLLLSGIKQWSYFFLALTYRYVVAIFAILDPVTQICRKGIGKHWSGCWLVIVSAQTTI